MKKVNDVKKRVKKIKKVWVSKGEKKDTKVTTKVQKHSLQKGEKVSKGNKKS